MRIPLLLSVSGAKVVSKSWKDIPRKKVKDESPQATIDRLCKEEAEEDIREALTAPQEAPRAS